MNLHDEPLLKENPLRFVMFPIVYHDIWHMYKKHQSTMWTAEEITLIEDRQQFNSELLTPNEKHFIKMVLAFFASTDGIVNENLACNFYNEIQIPEARSFYAMQMLIETVHGETYSLLIDTLIEDKKEKNEMFAAIFNYPSIANLSQWALKWLNNDKPFNQRLIAFACVEGILFSGPFCAIFWLKKKGLMPGLTFSNELISRDEALHCDFAALLHTHLQNPATYEQIVEIVKEAVTFEKEFITESLPCNLMGMNAMEMSKYIEYVADQLLTKLHCKKYWNTPNPFAWMDLISTENKTNFFEKRVGEYSKAKFNKNTLGSEKGSSSIAILDDF